MSKSLLYWSYNITKTFNLLPQFQILLFLLQFSKKKSFPTLFAFSHIIKKIFVYFLFTLSLSLLLLFRC